MKFLTNAISKLENIVQQGTDTITDTPEIKRIRITNYSLLIAILTVGSFNIFYTIVDFWRLLPVIINYDIFIFVFVIALFLNKNNHHLAAKLLLHLGISIPTLIHTTLLSGSEPGIHFYFLLYALLPVLYWSLKDFAYILFFLFFNLAAFIYVEFFVSAENMMAAFPESSIFFFRLISMILSFLTIAFLILLYQFQAEKNEKELFVQSEDLKSINKHLLKQKEQIELQKDELHHVNMTKDKIFSIIAHDLKSPFNALLGFSELLLIKNEVFKAEERKELLEAIYETADRTLGLLNNLLIWSQVETGQIHFVSQKIELNKIIEGTVALQKNVAAKKNIEINFEPQDNFMVYVDKDMIATVVRNLISNAIKFSHKGAFIRIATKKVENNQIQVSISDNGIGISNEKLESIFDSETTLSMKGTEGEKGTGLGLKLCKEFIEENNGQIRVESKAGEGSTFYFTVPEA
jgi:signal transduction histidine kinase